MRAICKIPFIMMVAALLAITPACAGRYLPAAEQTRTVVVIVKMIDAEFWKTVKAGADAAGKEFGVNVDFEAPKDERDISEQIALVNHAIDRKVDAIVLAAGDYKNLVPVTEKAIASKIPVIVIDSALDSKKISSFVATDNRKAGMKVGEKLVEIAGKNCHAAVMSFVKGSAPADQREEGFLSALKNYPEVSIVAKEYCFSDSDYARELALRILDQHPEVDAFVGLNALATEGVARALQERDVTHKIKVVGFDSTPDEIYYLEKSVIHATVVQRPFNMGYLGVKYAVMRINGQSVPAIVDTGSVVIDRTNMYTPENQKLLFPFAK